MTITHPSTSRSPWSSWLSYLGLCLVGAWFFAFSCTSAPECVGDNDCVQKFSEVFVCYNAKCYDKNELRLDAKEPTLEGQSTEKFAETAPDRQRETQPETKKEAGTPDTNKVPTIEAKELEPCDATKDYYQKRTTRRVCGAGLFCLKVKHDQGICFKDCSKNAKLCKGNKGGRTVCRRIYGRPEKTTLSICVKEVGKNAKCEAKEAVYCAKSGPLHRVCRQGKCVDGKICRAAGCDCNPGLPIPVECDPSQGLTCAQTAIDKFRCVIGQTVQEGEYCFRSNRGRVCDIGYYCLGLSSGSTDGYCYKRCDLKNPQGSCAHSPELLCLQTELAQSPVCLQKPCSSQQDCLFLDPPHRCISNTRLGRICLPFTGRPGPRKFGEPCDLNSNSKGCDFPFICLNSGNNKGYCGLQCNTRNDCARLSSNANCVLNEPSGIRLCGWACIRDSQCPKGLVCRALNGGGASKFCQAPL